LGCLFIRVPISFTLTQNKTYHANGKQVHALILKSTTVPDLINEITTALEQSDLSYGHGMETALDEAAYLVSFTLRLPPDFDPYEAGLSVTGGQREEITNLLQQRIEERKPLVYLLGETWLAGYKFIVNEHVLVPRSPIASLIQERFFPWWIGAGEANAEPSAILDLCSGSGCLGILAALEFPEAQVVLTDIDPEALQLAGQNIQAHQLQNRVSTVLSDVWAQIPVHQYDIILANPPYVPQREQRELPTEYQHEPAHALYSGSDGLDVTKKILASISRYLTDDGLLVLEVGESAHALEQHFADTQFMWLALENGGEGVCVLTAEECKQFAM
jgi:ribosomal protein L3 glutamine methyltransferase